MRAAEVMTTSVQTVSPTLSAGEAWELMRRKSIRHLVVTSDSRIVGVLSSRDAGGRLGASVRARATVADLMTAAVVTVAPDTPIRKIANVMRGRSIGCVPVTDGRRLMGIVTISDLLELLGRGIDRPLASTRHELHHRVPHRKGRRAVGVW